MASEATGAAPKKRAQNTILDPEIRRRREAETMQIAAASAMYCATTLSLELWGEIFTLYPYLQTSERLVVLRQLRDARQSYEDAVEHSLNAKLKPR